MQLKTDVSIMLFKSNFELSECEYVCVRVCLFGYRTCVAGLS